MCFSGFLYFFGRDNSSPKEEERVFHDVRPGFLKR